MTGDADSLLQPAAFAHTITPGLPQASAPHKKTLHMPEVALTPWNSQGISHQPVADSQTAGIG